MAQEASGWMPCNREPAAFLRMAGDSRRECSFDQARWVRLAAARRHISAAEMAMSTSAVG
jgi:hypothetical protein